MSTNAKRSILIIITVIAVLFLLVKACQWAVLSNALKTNEEISKLDTNTYSQNAPKEYLTLFLDKSKLVCDNAITSKHRNIITEFHDEHFYIEVYKLDTLNGLPLGKIINEAFNDNGISKNLYYTDYSNKKQFEISYKLGTREKLSMLYFTLYGDHTQVVKKDDTVAYYYSKFENFSIKYQKEGAIDIYGKIKENFRDAKVPVEIMFLKRNNNLYFILLANKSYSANLDLYALYNLVIDKK